VPELDIANSTVALHELYIQGMCLTPPIHRILGLCVDTETARDGYYDEQYRLDSYDWSSYYKQVRTGLLHRLHRTRISRFSHCDHPIPDDDIESLLGHKLYANDYTPRISNSAATGSTLQGTYGNALLVVMTLVVFAAVIMRARKEFRRNM
jgi:hypothetical protein